MALYEMRKFVAPEFIFGVDARKRVGAYLRNMMARKVFVVCDEGVAHAGWLAELLAQLDEVGVGSAVFLGVTPNPKDYEVMEGVAAYTAESCDVIVAIGGGSVIDCAKAIGVAFANQCDVSSFEGIDKVEIPGPPCHMYPNYCRHFG